MRGQKAGRGEGSVRERPSFSVLCIEPGHGSVWLHRAHLRDGWVEGVVWDDGARGSPYLPADYYGEWLPMAFPVNHALKVDRSPYRDRPEPERRPLP